MMRGGFTLLETLMALVLVAVVVPLALGGISQGLRVVDRQGRVETAQRLAECRLAAWLADGSWVTAPTSGDFAAAAEDTTEDLTAYQWTLSTTPWRDGRATQVAVTVAWSEAEGDRVTLTTLAVAPTTGVTP